jgi:hypothetical protein
MAAKGLRREMKTMAGRTKKKMKIMANKGLKIILKLQLWLMRT